MTKSQVDKPFLVVRPGLRINFLIKEIVKHSKDAIIRGQKWGWWPRLIKLALASYLAELKAGTGKESQ